MKKIMFILILFSSCAYNLCKKESVGVSDVCCVAPPKVSNAFGLTDKQWNKGDILYYTFLDGTSTQKKKVRDGFREISAISNLKLPRENNSVSSKITFRFGFLKKNIKNNTNTPGIILQYISPKIAVIIVKTKKKAIIK